LQESFDEIPRKGGIDSPLLGILSVNVLGDNIVFYKIEILFLKDIESINCPIKVKENAS
jgi:hypothetical protein